MYNPERQRDLFIKIRNFLLDEEACLDYLGSVLYDAVQEEIDGITLQDCIDYISTAVCEYDESIIEKYDSRYQIVNFEVIDEIKSEIQRLSTT